MNADSWTAPDFEIELDCQDIDSLNRRRLGEQFGRLPPECRRDASWQVCASASFIGKR